MKTAKMLLGVAAAVLTTTFLHPVQAAVALAGDSPNGAVTLQPSNYAPSPALADIIKLVQAGVGDDVLLAFINRSPVLFNPTANDLIYLRDIGLSDTVMKVLLPVATSALPAPTEAPVQVASLDSPPPPAPATAVEITPQQPMTASYFYEPLSSYGKWVMVSGIGYCWQPTVAVVDPGWRPYAHRGHWIDTDCGWYWESDYSWGWAAFHYGRWSRHAGLGWVWTPDIVWAPAWVSWRHSDDYCGWAPLPPAACYRPGLGLSYYDGRTGVSLEFGLSHDHYTFVSNSHFYDLHPIQRAAPPTQVVNIYQNTTVVNNYTTVNNTTVIKHGANYAAVSKTAAALVTKVAIREFLVASGNQSGLRLNPVREPVLYRTPLTPPKPDKIQAVVKQLATAAAPAPVRSAAEQPATSPKPVRQNSHMPTTRPIAASPSAPTHKAEVSEAASKWPATDRRSTQPVRSTELVRSVQDKYPNTPQMIPGPVEVQSRNNSTSALPAHGQGTPALHAEIKHPVRYEAPQVLPSSRTRSPSKIEAGRPAPANPVPSPKLVEEWPASGRATRRPLSWGSNAI